MRILELDLIAFGPFTNHRIDLSGGQHGLHLIYGPNEAGKSSSLRAITDFLFGFPARTTDNFIHDHKALRLGACLQHSGGTILKAIRRKGNQKTLRQIDDETVIEDEELSSFLGDVDRNFFGSMFGINHERLRQGGQEIARGKGRLGELLFSAGAGLAGLQSVQQELNSDIDNLFKPTGRSGAILSGLRELHDLKKQMNQSLTSVESWKQHQAILSQAQLEKSDLDKQISQSRSELERLTRIQDAMTSIGIWKSQSEKYRLLKDVPRLDDDFLNRSTQLATEFRKAEMQRLELLETVRNTEQKFQSVESKRDLFTEAELIDSLRDRIGQYRRALADRPTLLSKKELIEKTIHELLRDLGLPNDLSNIESLRIPADRKVRISEQGVQIERLNERRKNENRSIQKLQLQISESEYALQQLPPPLNLARLKARLKTVQEQGDLEATLQSRTQELDRLRSKISQELNRLPHWRGSIKELENAALPSHATIDRFEQDLNSALLNVQANQQERDRESETIFTIDHQLSTLESERSIPTQEELDRIRALRNRGWNLMRDEWKSGTQLPDHHNDFLREADTSERLDEAVNRLIQAGDQISDRMRFEAETVALKGKLLSDRSLSERKLKRSEDSLAEAMGALRKIEAAWQDVWKSSKIEARSPNEMSDWLRRYEAIMQSGNQLQEIQTQVDNLTDKIRASRAALIESADPAMLSEIESLTLVELTRHLLGVLETNQQGEQERARRTRELNNSQKELAAAKSEIEVSQRELVEIMKQWEVEMSFLGLQGDTLVTQANARISMIEAIFDQKRESDNFGMRIQHIDRDTRAFESEIVALAQRVLPESTNIPPVEQLQMLVDRLDVARLADRQKLELKIQIDQTSARLMEVSAAAAAAQAELQELMRLARVKSMEELNGAALRSFDRAKEEEKLQDAERQIAGFSNGKKIEDFIAEAEAERDQADAIPSRIEFLTEAIKRLGDSRDIVLGKIRSAEIALEKFDGNSQAAEKNAIIESAVARLDEQIHSLAVLKMASTILNAGIEQHREKNQGPVLSRASQIFSRITLGLYSGLRVDFNDRGEPIILGVRSRTAHADSVVTVEGMSDGTCDQLYLALRLASLELWLQHHEPIPFIVDDILLNFDDERSLATLQVLAKLSEQTQVIFFTHHQHLVELAEGQRALKNVFVSRIQWKAETDKLSGLLF